MKDCKNCGCPEKKHCPGKMDHNISGKSREVWVTCVGRHCMNFCTCVEYIDPDKETYADSGDGNKTEGVPVLRGRRKPKVAA